jgi:hypothetical protein
LTIEYLLPFTWKSLEQGRKVPRWSSLLHTRHVKSGKPLKIVAHAELDLKDIDEVDTALNTKNASWSEPELKDRTQTSRTAEFGCSVKIFVVSDYQSSTGMFSVVGNAPITEVM